MNTQRQLTTGKWIFTFLIPLVLLLIGGLFFIPKLLAPKPQYNFIFMDKPYISDFIKRYSGFYRYDISKHQAQRISWEQAQQYTLSTQPQSPDGYRIQVGNDNIFGLLLFFVAPDVYIPIYLVGHHNHIVLNIYFIRSPSSFHFLGWIINDNTK